MADNGQSRTRAVVVISARQAPSDFHQLLIDRKTWRANGTQALRWTAVA